MNRRIKKKIMKKGRLNYKEHKVLNRLIKCIIKKSYNTTYQYSNDVMLDVMLKEINAEFKANEIPYIAIEDPWGEDNIIYLEPITCEE